MRFDLVSVPQKQAAARFNDLFLAGTPAAAPDAPKPTAAQVLGTTDHPPAGVVRGPLWRKLPTLREQRRRFRAAVQVSMLLALTPAADRRPSLAVPDRPRPGVTSAVPGAGAARPSLAVPVLGQGRPFGR